MECSTLEQPWQTPSVPVDAAVAEHFLLPFCEML